MNIEDYLKFRTPPIDMTLARAQIENMILQAWRNGANPEDAINTVLENKGIINSLEEQIVEHVNYQKKSVVQAIAADAKEEMDDYERRVNEALEYAQETLQAQAEEKKAKLYEQKSQWQAKIKAQNATKARLEEMRNRVRENIANAGGAERYKTVAKTLKATTNNDVIPQIIMDKIANQEHITTVNTQSAEYRNNESGEKKGLWKKVWGALTYKLW